VTYGQQTPVVVVEDSVARYVVVDGYKRVRALRKLGRDTVRATVWELEEAEALVLEQQMHRAEARSALEQGWLLRELVERFGWSQEELARRFDRSPSWVSRRLSLVKDLPEEIQERVRRAEIVPYAAMKYLVPLARANRSDCLRLVEALSTLRLSSRAMGRLYNAYVSADDKTRELVLEKPELFLKVDEEVRRPPYGEGRPVELLLSDFHILAAVARRAARRLEKGLGEKLVAPERERALRMWTQAVTGFEHLLSLCKKELDDVGPIRAHDDSDAPSERDEISTDCSLAPRVSRSGLEGVEEWTGGAGPPHARAEGGSVPRADPGALPVL
jgi:ParB/RepB/Spo0J family partition protein